LLGTLSKLVQHSGLPLGIAVVLIILLNLIGLAISTIVGIGWNKIAISFCDARKPSFCTLFAFRGCFWRYLGTFFLYIMIFFVGIFLLIVLGIIYIPIVFVGILLLIVPGIIWAVKFGLWPYFVIDKNLGPIQALKASSRTTMGVKWKIFGFDLLCSLIILLGLLCLIVGVLVAAPIVAVANALVYRHLMAQTPELAEFGINVPPPQPPQPTSQTQPPCAT